MGGLTQSTWLWVCVRERTSSCGSFKRAPTLQLQGCQQVDVAFITSLCSAISPVAPNRTPDSSTPPPHKLFSLVIPSSAKDTTAHLVCYARNPRVFLAAHNTTDKSPIGSKNSRMQRSLGPRLHEHVRVKEGRGGRTVLLGGGGGG